MNDFPLPLTVPGEGYKYSKLLHGISPNNRMAGFLYPSGDYGKAKFLRTARQTNTCREHEDGSSP